MSRTKALRVRDRLVWVWDNSIDIVLAFMIEEAGPEVESTWLADWRVWASVGDLGVEFLQSSAPDVAAIHTVVARARDRVRAHGDFGTDDLMGWSVLDGQSVSGGSIRGDSLSSEAVLDAADALCEMLAGRFPQDPEDGYWIVGTPEGRRQHHLAS